MCISIFKDGSSDRETVPGEKRYGKDNMNLFGKGSTLKKLESLSDDKLMRFISRDQITRRYQIIDRERVWFDINRDDIIENLHEHGKYDIYIISKRGRIKYLKRRNLLKVIALRFKYYKKYMVIVEIEVSQNPEAAQEEDPDHEIQTV